MKKKDYIFGLLYVLFLIIVIYLVKIGVFTMCNQNWPFIAGGLQFAIFATSGEILSIRILYGQWKFTKATAFKALVWGIGGLFVTLSFKIMSSGVAAAMECGLLPFYGNSVITAFFTSTANNLFFAPLHGAAMRVFDNYGEERFINKRKMNKFEAVNSVEWGEYVDFTIFKTIPFFWIPVNTISFLLPPDLRVASAAMLSFVFGMMMALLKLKERKKQGSFIQS